LERAISTSSGTCGNNPLLSDIVRLNDLWTVNGPKPKISLSIHSGSLYLYQALEETTDYLTVDSLRVSRELIGSTKLEGPISHGDISFRLQS